MSTLAIDVPMPRLSDSMEEGTIVRWLKAVGEPVAPGDPLVEIATDKADVVFEADVAGTLLEHVVPEDGTAAVGAPIARMGGPAAAPPAAAAASRGGDGLTAARVSGRLDRVERQLRSSPLARRLARELGVDLATVRGSGPGGRIIKGDVEAVGGAAKTVDFAPAVPAGSDAPMPNADRGSVHLVEPTTLQRTVARRMVESKTTIPHFHLTAEIDMTRCREARERLRELGEAVPSYNDMVVRACALALRARPMANAAWTEAGFELYERVNIGIAVAAEGALLVPSIFDADRKSLSEIAAESARLAELVRTKAITPAELAGGTFTVSNLGMHGVDEFAAVVNPPQAAILAVGAIVERPIGRDGELVLAPVMRATLGCDHRILYGADGAAVLADVRRRLEEPLGLAG